MSFLPVQRLRMAAAAAALAAASMAVAQAADISGAGATFPYPIYAKWADAYQKETGIGLNYQAIGSGGGIQQIKAKTVTFGASDMPLPAEQVEQLGLVQFPAIIGGAVPVVNIAGVKPGQMILSGALIAGIYLGDIAKWNDPRIGRLNPGLRLPNLAIAPVYRSDGSGTNFLFTDFLSKASDKFKTQVGESTSVQWPVGIGAKGNAGVANQAAQTQGAIGYVEYAYALQNHMSYAKLVNRDGRIVAPSAANFQAAAANADWAHARDFRLVLTDQPGAQSWPITGASFVLVYQHPPNPAETAQALKFYDWSFHHGLQMAESLDYVPLPPQLVQLIEQTWKTRVHGIPPIAGARAAGPASAQPPPPI